VIILIAYSLFECGYQYVGKKTGGNPPPVGRNGINWRFYQGLDMAG
jgi:hypothetical protein